MQVSLGNEKSFGKSAKTWLVYQNISCSPMIPEVFYKDGTDII